MGSTKDVFKGHFVPNHCALTPRAPESTKLVFDASTNASSPAKDYHWKKQPKRKKRDWLAQGIGQQAEFHQNHPNVVSWAR
jgi:hypothetical protein